MKKIFLSQALIALLALAAHAQSDKKVLTVADYDQATKAMGFNTSKLVFRANVNPNWLPDGRFWYSVAIPGGVEFVLINPADGSRKTGPDKKSILPEEQASSNSPATGRRRGGANESVSPDGKKAAFIRDWNLWVRDLETKKETQLTFDGVKDYGYATDNAGWTHSDRPIMLWSPDSKKIATFQQDQRHIHDMYLVKTKVGAPELEQWKYPLPEDKKIIQIERVIIEVDGPKVIRLKIPSDDRRGTLSDDITSDSPFDDNAATAHS